MIEPIHAELLEFRRSLYRPTPRQDVVSWAEEHIKLTRRQTEEPGPFSTSTRPYMREPMNDWRDARVSEVVLCWGSQTAKTTSLMAGAAWKICEDPAPMLWIMPSENLAKSFSKSRWMPMLQDSPRCTQEFPANRNNLSLLEQQFLSCPLNFVGSNSPGNLASRPVGCLIADEVDKFADATEEEADALNLAEQRLKAFSSSKLFLTSTPTVLEGRIWQRYLQGDMRKFLIPCPHCQTPIELLWKQVKWDERAKGKKGWDLRQVQATAGYVCQICNSVMTDAQKVPALRKGRWVATNPEAMPGVRSYHLSSLYAPGRKCTWGALATLFLREKESLLGLQGFINGYLAEPWESQDTLGERREMIVSGFESGDKRTRLMYVDCQAKSPAFWVVVREFCANGDSLGLFAGSADTWEEVRGIQLQHAVPNAGVGIDSGWGARSDAEVYKECAKNSTFAEEADRLPLAIGWTPFKGFPSKKYWRDTDTGLMRPLYARDVDPFEGSSKAGLCRMTLIGFSGDEFKDILQGLREGRGRVKWAVSPEMASEEYWRHMDGEHKVIVRSKINGSTKSQWVPRSKHWPNHLFDCEVGLLVLANFLGIFEIDRKEEPSPAE